jgi:hypothetical protein
MSSRPRDYLKQWFEHNQSIFEQHCIDFKLSLGEEDFAVSVVELDLEKFATNILVWDHSYCIDIEVVNLETDEVLLPVFGPNKSFEDFVDRLNCHLSWVQNPLSELNITNQ